MRVSNAPGAGLAEDFPAGSHAARFYDDDGLLERDVATFVHQGITAGETCILLATQAHSIGIRGQLAKLDVDLGSLEEARRLIFLDAHATLASLNSGGTLDGAAFLTMAGKLLEEARSTSPSGRVRGYGELVGLLADARLFDSAIRLEELWDELLKSEPLTLF